MIAYPGLFEYDDEDKVYNVRFPDLPGCLTYGETIEEAKEMAREALTGYLQSIDARKVKIPNPANLKGDEVVYIEPETPVALAIWLRKQREALGLSKFSSPSLAVINCSLNPYQCWLRGGALDKISSPSSARCHLYMS